MTIDDKLKDGVSQQQKDLDYANELGTDVRKYVAEWYADKHTGEHPLYDTENRDPDDTGGHSQGTGF